MRSNTDSEFMKFHFATWVPWQNGMKCQFFLKKKWIHKKFVKPYYQTKLSQKFAIPLNDSNAWKKKSKI